MDKLKPCPHCGKTETLEFATRREEEDCPRFEDCEAKECKRGACDYFDTWDSVVCSVSSGGCGASGGYASCPAKAAEKWNTRVERTCEKLPSLTDAVCIVRRGGMVMYFGYWRCSECQCENFESARYCMNCGARVERREQ